MRWCVAGGGIGGCYAAAYLAKSGCKVTLLEGASKLGGILCGPTWNGFALDNGCHLFDFADDESQALFRSVMGDDVVPVRVTYASVGDYGREPGIAVPNFSAAPQAIREELVLSVMRAVHAGHDGARTMPEAVADRFGVLLANELMPGLEKLCGAAAASLAPEAFDILSYAKRVRLGCDEEMADLKSKGQALDDRLAVKAKPMPEPRNYYPSRGGMAYFSARLKEYLEGLGVTVLLETRVERIEFIDGKVRIPGVEEAVADKLFWSMPAATLSMVLRELPDIRGFFHPVSVDLYAFALPPNQIEPLTYLHDYRAGTPVFRCSSPGLYGGQINKDGNSFVIAEVYDSLVSPTRSPQSKAPDRIFEQLKEVGQVTQNAQFAEMHAWRLPAGLVLPKLGWLDAIKPLSDRMAAAEEWLISNPLVPRGKRSIFAATRTLLDLHLPG